jgi:upstream activation factor subunit UAF30
MVFDINSLEPSIRAILSAPGTDLATISAKRVRKQLLEVEPSLTQDFLKENKEAVDGVIASVFEAISAEMGGIEAASQTPEEEPVRSKSARKRKSREEDDFEDVVDEEVEEVGSITPPPKKAKKGSKNGRELSDAELARQLSSEINGRSRRSGGRARASNGSSPKKGSRKKKSAAMVESDGDESDDDDTKRSKPKKRAGGTAKGGFAKEYILRSVWASRNHLSRPIFSYILAFSEPLAAVLNAEKLSRPQVVKHLWEYIKGHELQNPANRREIMCDDGGLRAVFGVDKIDMFRMNKVLGQCVISPLNVSHSICV